MRRENGHEKQCWSESFPKIGIEWMKTMQVRDKRRSEIVKSIRKSLNQIYLLVAASHHAKKTRSDFGFWLHFRCRFPRLSFILKAQEKLTLQFCRIELNISSAAQTSCGSGRQPIGERGITQQLAIRVPVYNPSVWIEPNYRSRRCETTYDPHSKGWCRQYSRSGS